MPYLLIAAASIAGVSAWTDSRSGHIPNWLTIGALGLGIATNVALGCYYVGSWRGGVWGAGYSLTGAFLCSIVPAFLYWKGGIGGGDVKLFAALGALCLPMVGLEMETYAFIFAALIAPMRLAYQGVLLQTLGRSLALLVNPFRKRENRTEIPETLMTWFRLGPAIFLGAAMTTFLHWYSP